MHILEAMGHMVTSLAAEDAPGRQLDGVRRWAEDIAAAVDAAQACGSAAGTDTSPAWPGLMITHRSWLVTCETILDALRTQQATAAAIYEAALAAAEQAKTKNARNAALARAARAADWQAAASRAENTGLALVACEDAIIRPVGEAIAAAGGIGEVAMDKHYHQGVRR